MDLNSHKPKFAKVIERLKVELTSIRTNRVSPALIEAVMVSTYEGAGEQPLKELAAISVPEPRQLLVEPWDKSVIKAIEAALESTELGFSVSNEGSCVRLTMPIMTDEVRAGVKKTLHEKLEASRVAIRKQRDGVKDEINRQEKSKEISEDDKFRLVKELNELTKEFTDQVSELGEVKEKEISA